MASARRSIVVGLLLYNFYCFTNVFLLADILWTAIVLRLLVVTPASLGLAWLIGRVDGSTREWLLTIGVANAFVLPVGLFWFSNDPYAVFTFGEFALILVFASMLLPLRFPFACGMTLFTLLGTTLAVFTKPGLSLDLCFAFTLQFATASLFTLYANWRVETARCLSFLREFDTRQRAMGAETLSREFRQLSQVDALTGLPNRRALDSTLQRWLDERRSLSILMIDVDFFKLYNDRLGHPEGDECLRAIACRLADLVVEAGGFVARFGGEEFTVLVADRSELQSIRLAGDLVDGIRSLALAHPGRSDGMAVVTISAGLAMVEGSDLAAQAEAMTRADEALYQAKQRGRNQWVLAKTASKAATA